MTDFALARKNMIDSQIATMGVIDHSLLDILGRVPRELFVPQGKQAMAYSDEDLPLGNGAFLMEPLIFARLVQAGAPQPGDSVLCIGDPTGYAASVLSELAGRVIALETARGQFESARRTWESLSCHNIEVAHGAADAGCPEQGLFSLIFIFGSAPAVPPALTAQLEPGRGRLLAVLRKPEAPCGQAVIMERLADGVVCSKMLFDAATPFVPELIPKQGFVF